MSTDSVSSFDQKYLSILLNRINVCKRYKPQFGQGQKTGLSLDEFQTLYSADVFYSWFGLDTPMIYAAHKAAGGITSVYRQIGIGCEEVVRQLFVDHLGLKPEQAKWSYTLTRRSQKRTLSLDGRIAFADIPSVRASKKISAWLNQSADYLDVAPKMKRALQGAVFEIRQGYKSKDSKRQNADLANAATAYSQGYLPVVLMLSTQIDSDIAERYEGEKWLILRGTMSGSSIQSTYAFARDVIGYDLTGFFQRNSSELKTTIEEVLRVLLNAND
ncbi:MAG: hypothetical protein HZC38_06525 [Chloroflexi bacterium]|nr:hypothetical protein [Chloroflexota bacterium]